MSDPLPQDEAKQSHGGKTLLIVMICALLLAGAIWWGVEWYGESIESNRQIGLEKSDDAPQTPTGPVTSHEKPADTQTPPAN